MTAPEHRPRSSDKRERRCTCGAKLPSPKELRQHVRSFEISHVPTAMQAAPVARSPHQGRRRGAYG